MYKHRPKLICCRFFVTGASQLCIIIKVEKLVLEGFGKLKGYILTPGGVLFVAPRTLLGVKPPWRLNVMMKRTNLDSSKYIYRRHQYSRTRIVE